MASSCNTRPAAGEMATRAPGSVERAQAGVAAVLAGVVGFVWPEAGREISHPEVDAGRLRLRRAKLRHRACIEDVDFRQPRGLDKDLVLSLADGRWVREHLNVLITGPADPAS